MEGSRTDSGRGEGERKSPPSPKTYPYSKRIDTQNYACDQNMCSEKSIYNP